MYVHSPWSQTGGVVWEGRKLWGVESRPRGRRRIGCGSSGIGEDGVRQRNVSEVLRSAKKNLRDLNQKEIIGTSKNNSPIENVVIYIPKP